MKLEQQVEQLKSKITVAFEKQFNLLGIRASTITSGTDAKYKLILANLQEETNSYTAARSKALEEFTFTLFNRIAAIKVMEAQLIIPEVIIQRASNGGRSFAHKLWLEEDRARGDEEFEGLKQFIEFWFSELGKEINLYSADYLYHLLPDAADIKEIIDLFNDIEEEEWRSADIMGWLYESYNKTELRQFKESEAKIEYNKVSLTSQVYTPKWVVKFLVDNSLGKLYLEMHPDSGLKSKYKIANAPQKQMRTPKKATEIKLIDPAPGSGNFLLYAFDFFYDIYLEEGYDEDDIPKLIIENNLYGVDIDDRAIQIAQLGLYIKAKEKNRHIRIERFNIVSADFYLPEYETIKDIFELNTTLDPQLIRIVKNVWDDLRNANKFGSLIEIEGRVSEQLRGIREKSKDTLFEEQEDKIFESFEKDYFNRLKNAVKKHSTINAKSFIESKTLDSLTYLEIITQKYDVAVANPPYTDSGNYGEKLKEYVSKNYKKPHDFYANLYACFLRKCYELTESNGIIGMIHPMTFMYIKSFESMREFILDKTHIGILVEYGLSNLFGVVMVDPAIYVLEKHNISRDNTLFISLDQYTRTSEEKNKKQYCLQALFDYIDGVANKHNYILPQSKLKSIKSYPFIYWISDEFREKFAQQSIEAVAKVCSGLSTANNNRYLRFWWELGYNDISLIEDKVKWVFYAKGGPYNKWYGNLWLVLEWSNNGKNIKSDPRVTLRNQNYYFKRGLTCSGRSSAKGATYRILPSNCIFDVGATGIIPIGDTTKNDDILYYLLGLMNSNTIKYILNCLNPTVNTTEGDLQRIPYSHPSSINFKKVLPLSKTNATIKESLCSFSIIEYKYRNSPLFLSYKFNHEQELSKRIFNHYNYENFLQTLILINEAIINQIIYDVYSLSDEDRVMVELKEGKPVATFPLIDEARLSYIKELNFIFETLPELIAYNATTLDFLKDLPTKDPSDLQNSELKESFGSLYQSNNDLEEFCIKNNENPINIWYLFREAGILPQQRSQTIAMELLVDFAREILMEDADGIVPNVAIPGEKSLSELIEAKFYEKGFTSAQYSQFSGLLGREVNKYLDNYFFKDFSDHLNLFMYLPKTPFIWHLSSGDYQGFEAFIIIYKWSRDTLFKLKSYYVDKRESRLRNRLIDVSRESTAQALNEADVIKKQLSEVEAFKKKLDDLLASGYNPKLDDGVGKNIAPLQQRGMLKYEVLNKGQLKKYLDADW